jgi:hypothetical protein
LEDPEPYQGGRECEGKAPTLAFAFPATNGAVVRLRRPLESSRRLFAGKRDCDRRSKRGIILYESNVGLTTVDASDATGRKDTDAGKRRDLHGRSDRRSRGLARHDEKRQILSGRFGGAMALGREPREVAVSQADAKRAIDHGNCRWGCTSGPYDRFDFACRRQILRIRHAVGDDRRL